MRTVKYLAACWLLAAWRVAGGLRAVRQYRRHRQCQSAAGQRGRRHRSRPVDSGSPWNSTSATAGTPIGAIRATPARPRSSPGSCRPGFTAGDIVWTTPHRFEIPPAGQLRLCQARHASGQYHCEPRTCRPGTPAVLSAKAELAGLFRRVHSGKCQLAIEAAGQCTARRRRCGGRGAVHGRAQRAAQRANLPQRLPGSRTAGS